MPRPRTLAFVILGVALVASCSGGSAKPEATVRTAWDPAALVQLKALGRQIASRLPGQCTKMDVVPADVELAGIRRIGGTVTPSAMGTCTIFGESEELSEFPDAKTRDAWVNERARLFCASSQRHDVGFPGLHWVTGPTWSLLADTEGVGRRIACGTGASYRGTPCPGQVLDWDPGAVAEAQGLADKISTAKLGCGDFSVDDLDAIRRDPAVNKIGLPATLATCTLRRNAQKGLIIAVTRPKSVSLQKLVTTTSANQCATLPSSAVVVGHDWAAFTERDVVAARLARILGGSVRLCAQ